MKSVVKALKANTKLNDNKILVIEKILENNGTSALTVKDLKANFLSDDLFAGASREVILEATGMESKKLSGVLLGMTRAGELFNNKDCGRYEVNEELFTLIDEDTKVAKAKRTPKAKKTKVARYTRVHSIIQILQGSEFAIDKKTLMSEASKLYCNTMKIEHTDETSIGRSMTGRVLLSLELTGQLDTQDLENNTYRLIKMKK